MRILYWRKIRIFNLDMQIFKTAREGKEVVFPSDA